MYEKKIWFKRKKYGIGWTPAAWEGWIITLIYPFLLILPIIFIRPWTKTIVTIWYGYLTTITIAYIYVCYRFGEPLKWRWGNQRDEMRDDSK